MKNHKLLLRLSILGLSFAMMVPSALGYFSIQGIDPSTGDFARDYLNLKAMPGSTVEAQIAISNNTDPDGMGYEIFALDAMTDEGDLFKLVPRNTPQSHIGLWTTVTPSTLTINEGDYELVDIAISVPEDVEIGDLYWGSIVATNVLPTGENATGDGSTGMTTVIQIGTRVSLEIVDESAFEDTDLVEHVKVKSEVSTETNFVPYIVGVVIILIAAVVIVVQNKKGGKKKRK